MSTDPATDKPETEEKNVLSPETEEPKTDAATEETPATETAEATEEAPAAEAVGETTETPAETAEAPEPTDGKKNAVAGVLLDTLLVLLLAGALGGGCWYLNKELSKYRVPGPMELAAQENIELCKEREALQAPAYHADEQLHMRKRLASLVRKHEELKRQIEEKKRAVETGHQQVLAVQHEIRQEDKASRSVAKGLLPGMPIGDATTTTGKLYRNAVIHRLEGKKITLRTPEGQMRFPVNTLVKDRLPDLARYAFGLDDMVDMSDFEATADQPAPKARKGKLIAPKAEPKEEPKADSPADYEPAAGAPVVDTDANRTSTWTGESEDAPEQTPAGTWQPPAGELPF